MTLWAVPGVGQRVGRVGVGLRGGGGLRGGVEAEPAVLCQVEQQPRGGANARSAKERQREGETPESLSAREKRNQNQSRETIQN